MVGHVNFQKLCSNGIKRKFTQRDLRETRSLPETMRRMATLQLEQTSTVRLAEFERTVVDTAVQEKPITPLLDSRLLDIARAKLVRAARRAGIALKQTFCGEGRRYAAKPAAMLMPNNSGTCTMRSKATHYLYKGSCAARTECNLKTNPLRFYLTKALTTV
jgi:hypothetical protein